MAEACCTCATLRSNIAPLYDEKTEKLKALDRRLECCNRVICGTCIYNNPRFDTYCTTLIPIHPKTEDPEQLTHPFPHPTGIFCQISTVQSSPLQNPRTHHAAPLPLPPPPYNAPPPPTYLPAADELPPYTNPHALIPGPEKSTEPANDVLHFLNHSIDSMHSLSLRYGVPISALRRANGITSDHLLLARRTVLIPGDYYKGGVSLSPGPLEGEEEEMRKGKIRRWMMACKVAEYDVALLYLKQADYDLDEAIEAYKDDESWEKEHPLEASVKGKGKAKYDLGKRRFTGQRS